MSSTKDSGPATMAPRPPGDLISKKGYKLYHSGRVATPSPESLSTFRDMANATPKFLRLSQFYISVFNHTSQDYRLPLYVDVCPFPTLHNTEEPVPVVEAPKIPTSNGTVCPQCTTCHAWLSPTSSKLVKNNENRQRLYPQIFCKFCDSKDSVGRKSYVQSEDDKIDPTAVRGACEAILEIQKGTIDFEVFSTGSEIAELDESRHLHVFIIDANHWHLLSAIRSIDVIASHLPSENKSRIAFLFLDVLGNPSINLVSCKRGSKTPTLLSIGLEDDSVVLAPTKYPYCLNVPEDIDEIKASLDFVANRIQAINGKLRRRCSSQNWIAAINAATSFIKQDGRVSRGTYSITCLLGQTPLQRSFGDGDTGKYTEYTKDMLDTTNELISDFVKYSINLNIMSIMCKADAEPALDSSIDPFMLRLVRNSGGWVYDIPKYRSYRDDKPIHVKIWNQFTILGGFNTTCKIRASHGIRVRQLLSPWSNPTVKGGGREYSCDAFRIPFVDRNTGFTFELEQYDDLDRNESKKLFIQFAIRYTDPYTRKKRVRVCTISNELTPSISSLYRFADVYSTMSGLSKCCCLDILRQYELQWKDPSTRQEEVHSNKGLFNRRSTYLLNNEDVRDLLVANLLTYRLHCAPGGYNQQLVLPEGLKILPLAASAIPKVCTSSVNQIYLLRSSACGVSLMLTPRLFVLQEGTNQTSLINPKDNKYITNYHQAIMTFGEPSNIPGLYELPPSVMVSSASILPGGIYLLFTWRNAFVYVTKDSFGQWEDVTNGLYSADDDVGKEDHYHNKKTDSPALGVRIRRVINTLVEKHQMHDPPPIWLIYEDQADQVIFFNNLMEDNIASHASYSEYIRSLHKALHRQYTSL